MVSDVPKLQPARKARERALFIEWLLTPESVRKVHGLPTTEKAFADAHACDTRQLRRWKQDPAWEAVLAARRKERLREAPDVGAAPSAGLRPKTLEQELVAEAAERGVEPGTDEYDYLQIKVSLRRAAVEGDVQAAREWMKLFGEPLMEAERQEKASIFPSLSDDELVDRTLRLVGAERVAAWLAEVAS